MNNSGPSHSSSVFPKGLSFSSNEGTILHPPELHAVVTAVDVQSVARYFGGNRYLPDQNTTHRIQLAIKEAGELVTPTALYHLYKVQSLDPGKKIVLEGGAHLDLPDCLEAAGTQTIATIVATLGPTLEEKCRDLAKQGEVYQSTLFDAIGTVMLDQLSEHVCAHIAEDGKLISLSRGPRFAPGIDGYPLENQTILFSLTDHDRINVRLNSSAVMFPTKSVSFFMTLTTGIKQKMSNHKCSQCKMTHCQFRTAPPKESRDFTTSFE